MFRFSAKRARTDSTAASASKASDSSLSSSNSLPMRRVHKLSCLNSTRSLTYWCLGNFRESISSLSRTIPATPSPIHSILSTSKLKISSGWWFQPTPLKNDGLKVSWDDDIPNWMEKQNSRSKPATSHCSHP